ncbi:MAG TPA: nucleoside triphosphate pyrophosphatase [Rhodoferax sp.]|nr:nucleoside triphosphate pyrophosphatase [Rhodoferax sp.]
MGILMGTTPRRIYLCSQSPRCRELLKQIGINFEMLLLRGDPHRGGDFNEALLDDETAESYVQRICQEKARAGAESLRLRSLPPFPVLAAETIVVLNGKIFGKPDHVNQAADMLRQLSGNEHQVLSAVAVALGNRTEMALSVSTVRFASLSEDRIQRYLLSREYADKAGAYSIQGQSGAFVEYLAGSYSGVMGLPLSETVDLLQRFDYPTP